MQHSQVAPTSTLSGATNSATRRASQYAVNRQQDNSIGFPRPPVWPSNLTAHLVFKRCHDMTTKLMLALFLFLAAAIPQVNQTRATSQFAAVLPGFFKAESFLKMPEAQQVGYTVGLIEGILVSQIFADLPYHAGEQPTVTKSMQ